MSHYTPDGWVFLKVQVEGCDPTIKVFASWSGDYLKSPSWRVNSGCTKIQDNENEFIVSGYSGSQYILKKQNNHITSYSKGVLQDMLEELKSYGHQAEIISVQEAITIIED